MLTLEQITSQAEAREDEKCPRPSDLNTNCSC